MRRQAAFSCAPTGLAQSMATTPRLAAWVAFFRRFAALRRLLHIARAAFYSSGRHAPMICLRSATWRLIAQWRPSVPSRGRSNIHDPIANAKGTENRRPSARNPIISSPSPGFPPPGGPSGNVSTPRTNATNSPAVRINTPVPAERRNLPKVFIGSAYCSRVTRIQASIWSRYSARALRPVVVRRYSVRGTRPSKNLTQEM